MFNYAQIDGGICIAVTQTHEPVIAPNMVPLAEYSPALLGQAYSGGVFTPVRPAPLPRHVTQLAFRRRFTRDERTAIEWAAVDRAEQPEEQRRQAAQLRADLTDQAQARYIDLDDPDTISGVLGLEAIGLLLEGRAEEILGAPVQAEERA